MLYPVIKLLQKNNDVAFAQHQMRRSFVRSLTEITEYARYACEGKLDEQSHYYSRRMCDTGNADVRLLWINEKFLLWTRRTLWIVPHQRDSAIWKCYAGSLPASAIRPTPAVRRTPAVRHATPPRLLFRTLSPRTLCDSSASIRAVSSSPLSIGPLSIGSAE